MTIMKNFIRFLTVPLLLVLFVSPTFASAGKERETEGAVFPLPAIPDSISVPAQRADFLLTHFWDNVDFNSLKASRSTDFLEQGLADFLSVLPHVSSDSVAVAGFGTMLERVSSNRDAFTVLTGLADDYLSGKSSPFRSDDFYISYLSALSNTKGLLEQQKARIEDKIEMVSKNRIGSVATDFSITTISGVQTSLYEFIGEGPGDVLLIFFDPDCGNCEVILGRLGADSKLRDAIAEGALRVLAVYSGDDEKAWRRKAESLPPTWGVALNKGDIEEDDLYYLPEMPTLYLLDSGGMVLDREMNGEVWSFGGN